MLLLYFEVRNPIPENSINMSELTHTDDMGKAVDRGIIIGEFKLLEKSGSRSDVCRREV